MKNLSFKTLFIALISVFSVNFNAIVFNTIFAGIASAVLGLPSTATIVIWNVLALRLSPQLQTGRLFAGVQKEIWLAEIIEDFYPVMSWLIRGRDMSALVDNNTINLAEAGILPNVLVNNTTYPVITVGRTDNPIDLVLDTLDTENTVVRNIEEMEAAYNKMQSVTKGHKDALRLMCYRRAAHAYTPASNTANTPVIVATGADDGTGRKRLTLQDLAKAQTAIEMIDGIDPDVTKTLVLSAKHKEDLILEDKDLFKAFANLATGRIFNLLNFSVASTYNGGAVYNTATGVKKAFGAVAAGTDSLATSFFFADSEVMYADGEYDMFSKQRDPGERGDVVGFQKRFIALPLRNKGIGSIYSSAA